MGTDEKIGIRRASCPLDQENQTASCAAISSRTLVSTKTIGQPSPRVITMISSVVIPGFAEPAALANQWSKALVAFRAVFRGFICKTPSVSITSQLGRTSRS